MLAGLPDHQQDAVKAELDHLASLSDANELLSAEQVRPGEGIDLEGLEGVQDVLLMLSVEHPHIVNRVSAQASLMRRTGGKNWSAFQFEEDGKLWALEDETARAAFLADTLAILDLPAHRRREADWYQSIRLHPITGEESPITQATIYVEERAESELAFGAETLERHIVQKGLEVGIACDPKERIVEICSRGRPGFAASETRRPHRKIRDPEPARGGDEVWQEHRHVLRKRVRRSGNGAGDMDHPPGRGRALRPG